MVLKLSKHRELKSEGGLVNPRTITTSNGLGRSLKDYLSLLHSGPLHVKLSVGVRKTTTI